MTIDAPTFPRALPNWRARHCGHRCVRCHSTPVYRVARRDKAALWWVEASQGEIRPTVVAGTGHHFERRWYSLLEHSVIDCA